MRRWTRQVEEPVHIARALESLLDLIDEQARSGGGPPTIEPILPFSTGRLYLDRLLGGGMRSGTVTVFEADTPDAARPLLIDIVGHVDHATLLACGRIHWDAAGLWSAAARVSQQQMADGTLDEAEWSDLSAVIGDLACRELWITETVSYESLEDGVRRHGVEILAVEDVSRYSHPYRVLGRLVEMAVELGVAVVATSSHLALDDLRGGDRLVRVGVHQDGGRSTLVRPDPIDLLRVEDVFVDHVTGFVN